MLRRALYVVPLLASACSAGEAGEAARDFGPSGVLPAPNMSGSPVVAPAGTAFDGQGGLGSTAPPPALPPEMELSFEFELPHAGDRYVYAVNPDSDSVAVIDATSLAIHSVEAGDEPTFLQTLAGRDAAIVLNVRSADATLIRTEDGNSKAISVPVQVGANAIAVAPDGNHAVVYFNSNSRGAGASGSFQDISVLFLEEGNERAEAMTVGFRPSAVSFSADGKRAFVVTEDGVSLLDFAQIESEGPAIAKTVALGDDAAASLDVSVTPDGKYALARREGESELRLANLETAEVLLLDLAEVLASNPDVSFDVDAGALSLLGDAATDAQADAQGDAQSDPEPPVSVADAGASDAQTPVDGALVDSALPTATAAATATATATATNAATATATATGTAVPPALNAAITDVDLAPSGDYALAVVRDQSTVLQVDIPGAFDGSSQVRVLKIGEELVGSVSIAPDSQRALLFTTAVETEERISVLDLADGEYRPVRLPKSVESVKIADNSKTALIIHKKLAGSPEEVGITPDAVLDRSFGYSVLDLASGFSKLQTTRSAVGPSTIVPDGSNLFVLFNDKALVVQEVHQVNLQSFVVKSRELGSPPTSIGSVPSSKKVFIGQEHPDGRIAFIDWETGSIESVTGFELNSRIRE